MRDELRGKDGVETITRNSDGGHCGIRSPDHCARRAGHTVQLTIDSRFQEGVTRHWPRTRHDQLVPINTGSMSCRRCRRGAGCEGRQKKLPHRITPTASTSSLCHTVQRVGQCRRELATVQPWALQGLYTWSPPSNPLWRSPRWMAGSLTAIPRSTVLWVHTYYKDYRLNGTQHGHGNGPIDVVNTSNRGSCSVLLSMRWAKLPPRPVMFSDAYA